MPGTSKSHSDRQIKPTTIAAAAVSLAAVGAAAALVANIIRRQIPAVSSQAIKFPVSGHNYDEPIYILVGGQREGDQFSDTLNNWLLKFGDKATLFGYSVSVSDSKTNNITCVEQAVNTALGSESTQRTTMAEELSALIQEASNHTKTVIVQSYQGTDVLSEQAVKLLPVEIQKKVNLLSLAATLK